MWRLALGTQSSYPAKLLYSSTIGERGRREKIVARRYGPSGMSRSMLPLSIAVQRLPAAHVWLFRMPRTSAEHLYSPWLCALGQEESSPQRRRFEPVEAVDVTLRCLAASSGNEAGTSRSRYSGIREAVLTAAPPVPEIIRTFRFQKGDTRIASFGSRCAAAAASSAGWR